MLENSAKPVILLMAFLFIAACSIKTLYNSLDFLIPEYIEGILTLDIVLEEELELRIESVLDWHRDTQLEQYASWLKSIQQSAGPALTPARVKTRIDEMDGFWYALAEKLIDEVSGLLPKLDNQQQQELFRYLDEKNEAFREAYIDLDDEARSAYYGERLLDTYANWLGDLTRQQENDILKAAKLQLHTAELELERRREWQDRVSRILGDSTPNDEKYWQLRDFMSVFVRDIDPELQRITEHNRRIFIDLTVKVSHGMTDAQRAHFVEKTDKYITMFTELAEEV